MLQPTLHRGVLLIIGMIQLAGCATGEQTAGLLLGSTATSILAGTPSNELEQVYYLGVFDPQEQLPPSIYRVRVRGQASAFSNMRFASGWVPAPLIDSLGSSLSFSEGTGMAVEQSEALSSTLSSNRRLMLFGPEGFREAPKDHRLVIMMGSSPEKFFNAIDSALGTVAEAKFQRSNDELNKLLYQAMIQSRRQKERLEALLPSVQPSAIQGGA